MLDSDESEDDVYGMPNKISKCKGPKMVSLVTKASLTERNPSWIQNILDDVPHCISLKLISLHNVTCTMGNPGCTYEDHVNGFKTSHDK